MEDLYDPEEKILCPYNSSHHIRRCRMAVHIVKCKKNYSEHKMVSCDFNATHMVPEPELAYHHQSCPDRKTVETQIIEGATSNAPNRYPMPTYGHEIETDWDTENVPTYNPQTYLENHDILRSLNVESEAKRRDFRLSERQRLGGMSTKSEPPSVPIEEKINLPKHRPVINIETDPAPESVQQRLKSNQKKIFMQLKK